MKSEKVVEHVKRRLRGARLRIPKSSRIRSKPLFEKESKEKREFLRKLVAWFFIPAIQLFIEMTNAKIPIYSGRSLSIKINPKGLIMERYGKPVKKIPWVAEKWKAIPYDRLRIKNTDAFIDRQRKKIWRLLYPD